jgi:hypothetical protein
MLRQEQSDLLDLVLSQTEFSRSLQLLLDNLLLVDDAFLQTMLQISLTKMASGRKMEGPEAIEEYKQGAVVADLALCARENGLPATILDLYLTSADNYANLPDREQTARSALGHAQELAKELRNPTRTAQALAGLAQLDLRENQNIDDSIDLLKQAVEFVQRDWSDADAPEVFRTLITLLGRSLHERRPSTAESELLQLIQPEHRDGAMTLIGLDPTDESTIQKWFRARAYLQIDFTGCPDDRWLDIAHGARERLLDHVSNDYPILKPSTDVFVGRLMSQFPISRIHVWLETLESDPQAGAVLLHELTHYISFSSQLGFYATVLTAGLYVLETALRDRGIAIDDPAEARAGTMSARHARLLTSFVTSEAKLRMLFQCWEPWMEGLALFSEVDLDLAESGNIGSRHEEFLASLPSDAGEEGAKDDSEHAARQKLERVRRVQRVISEHRRGNDYIYDLAILKKDHGTLPYFAGWAFVRALWNRWKSQCPEFANSVTFFETLIWLSLSSFTDLMPDWSLPIADFERDLGTRMRTFLRRVARVEPARLAVVAAQLHGSGSSSSPGPGTGSARIADLWNFFQNVSDSRSIDERMLTTAHTLQSQMLSQTGKERRLLCQYHRLWNRAIATVTDESRLHLLSDADFEIRLVGGRKDTWLLGVGQSASVEGPSGMLSFNLVDGDDQQLRAQVHRSGSGASRFCQFIRIEQGAGGLQFDFPTLITCGGLRLLPKALAGRAGRSPEEMEQLRVRLTERLGPQAQATRDQISRSLRSVAEDFERARKIVSANPRQSAVAAAFDAIASVVARFPSTAIDFYLAPVGLAASDERLNVFLSSDMAMRYDQQQLIKALLREPAPIPLDMLAEKLNRTPAVIRQCIEDLNKSINRQHKRRLIHVTDAKAHFHGLEFI